MTDSTIVPPKTSDVSWLLDSRKDALKKASCCVYLLAKEGLSSDDVGAERGTVSQEMRPGAGFKTGGFVSPFRAPEPLPILNPSDFVPKNGFPVVKGLKKSWGGNRRTTGVLERVRHVLEYSWVA